MIVAAIIAALLLTGCGSARRPPTTEAASRASSARAILKLQRDVNERLASPGLERGTWGVLVKSLESGQTLYSLNPGKLLVPASNMKVLTLAAAAERLGWDFTYETRLVAAGAVEGGELEGDLLVVGSGDPTVDDWDGAATELFRAWAERLKAAGIHTIGGRLIGDDNAFDDEPWGAGWAWDDLSASYAAAVGALQFNQNSARILVTAGPAAPAAPDVVVVPAASGLIVRNRLTTSDSGTPLVLAARRLPGAAALEIRGSIPAGAAPFFHNVSVENPTLYFLTRLRQVLVDNGIDVRGEAVDIDDLADVPPRSEHPPLLVHRSVPLSALAGTMMKLSQNLFAETLLRTLGGPIGVDGGRRAVRAVVEEWGVDPRDAVVADGSGLSRYNLVTAGCLVTLLTHAHASDRFREAFEAALPVAGREGTLANRMKGTPAEGNARAKSGSLSNARSLSGYVHTADGEPLVFAMIANHFGVAPDLVEETQDQIVARLARFTRR
jgi:D-alanyl-D-alanine carboxypeptidase/D-alanyl-D-alanine-endopeptidase (penicillin-binding protein 4)